MPTIIKIEKLAEQFPMFLEKLAPLAREGQLLGARNLGNHWFVHLPRFLRYFESPGVDELANRSRQ